MEPQTQAEARERPSHYVELALPVPLPQSFSYCVPSTVSPEPRVGDVLRVPFGRRKLVGVVQSVSRTRPAMKGLRDALERLPEPYRLDESGLELGQWVAAYYGCPLGEALSLLLPPRPGTAARRSPLRGAEATQERETPPQLSDPQQAALTAIEPAVDAPRYASYLLHGVTGSGKTEVYLRAIERVLAAGRSALVLLPEIALTPQTLRRLRRRFPGQVAPYHSRLSHGERCAVWEAAASGQISVVVGARSAVFTPLRNLGLIVVDEEHEPSFKADDRPRYHGRDVALMRAQLQGVPVILGSATPSLESFHNARREKHLRLVLPRRIGADRLPEVEIIDRRHGRYDEPVGPELVAALEETLGRGEQAIVFHNRRGFARYLQCRSCGDVIECPHCDISLTYHLKDDRLHCHYCGFRRPRPEACGACHERLLRPRGMGTQRVEVALESLFPQARILRLDHDTTGRKDAHTDILQAFGRREADILLGTQMVAKGLDFAGVTLVGVIDADAGLHFPDFRAHERAFQLLAQVAGRSGRKGPGRVLLQTFDPEHRVLERARAHDVDGFLEEELAERRALGYPPFRRLVALTVTAPEEPLLDRALLRLAEGARSIVGEGAIQILGPARAALPRINRRFRGQMLLKGSLSPSGKQAFVELFAQIKEDVRGGRKLDFALDVDPQQLL